MENRGRQKDRGKGLGNRENSRKGRSKSRLGKIECWNCGKKRTSEERLQSSKETKRWIAGEKSGSKCNR
jgi:hypothetical protein